MVKKYIKEIIDNHEKEFGVDFDICVRDTIEDNVNDGVYAFQVIYNGHYQVHEIKIIDYNLCIHEINLSHLGKMWSYDGGQRFQWTEMETLIFDPSIIRNIKIEEIIS
jgi:hypothetical protein